MQRFVAILLVAWWTATPAVCDAFLLSSSCSSNAIDASKASDHALAAFDSAEPDAPQPHPCHGAPEPREPAPASPDQPVGCCIGIDIGKPSKWIESPDLPTPVWAALPPFSELTSAHAAVVAIHATLLDELHSPYLRVNRPLLN